MLRKDRDRETMGGGKCLPISSSSKAHFSFPGTCSLGIVICMLQSQFPHSLSASIFFLLLPPFSSFSFFPYILPSLGSILTNLPFLGYLCQKHNVTMEITRTLMLDGPGVKPHPGPLLVVYPWKS